MCGCVSVVSTVSLIVPSLKLCSTAIAFTAQLASDYLSHTHRNKNTETHTAIFAYRFHLEIVILVIRQTERKHNYGTGFHSVTACVCVCVRDAMFLCQTCVVENVSVLYKQNIRTDFPNLLLKHMSAHFQRLSFWRNRILQHKTRWLEMIQMRTKTRVKTYLVSVCTL